tara:strand:- start:183 stop:398 length:216 start_codon:yes stop_codon:yes gene_type:complete
MDNPQVLKEIENLRGRRAYEEKRAAKFGFSTLYEYIEDKIRKKSINNACMEEDTKTSVSVSKSKDKSCGCC